MSDATTKPCSRCGETKPLEAFYVQSYGLYGRQSRCKPCQAAIRREWRELHPELADERDKRNYANLLVWRTAHPERTREISQHSRDRHRAERNAAMRAYARANPESIRERNDLYRARKRTAFVMRVSRRAIYERDGGKCGICGKPAPAKGWHLDHIIPLARGGTHEPKNVQVAHQRCNNRKYSTGPGQLRLLE